MIRWNKVWSISPIRGSIEFNSFVVYYTLVIILYCFQTWDLVDLKFKILFLTIKEKLKSLWEEIRLKHQKSKKIVSKDKLAQILKFWKDKKNQQLTIRDIKNRVWTKKQEIPQSDSTISRTLKSDLGMRYRTLSIIRPKIKLESKKENIES